MRLVETVNRSLPAGKVRVLVGLLTPREIVECVVGEEGEGDMR